MSTMDIAKLADQTYTSISTDVPTTQPGSSVTVTLGDDVIDASSIEGADGLYDDERAALERESSGKSEYIPWNQIRDNL